MVRRFAVLVAGFLFVAAGVADAQDLDAGRALNTILFGSQGQGALDLDVIAAIQVILPGEGTTFPLASSSGGFTWTFDPALGVQTRRTQSFGPMFAERPFTNGRKKLNIGIAFQHTGFDSLAGQPLSGLTTTLSPDSRPAPGTRLRTYNSSLSFTTNRTIVAASYGVTDRIDIGVLVPIEHTTASGSATSTLTILDVPAGLCVTAVTPDGRPSTCISPTGGGSGNVVIPVGLCSVGAQTGLLTCPFSENNIQGTSSGIGDIIFRGKFGIVSTPMMDLGAGVDLRTPTGDAKKLLGVPKPQLKVMVMGSSTFGQVAPHFNFGYTFAGSGLPFTASGTLDFPKIYDLSGNSQTNPNFGQLIAEPSDEVNYVFGADVAINQSLTIMGDVIGRNLRHGAAFNFVTQGASSYFTISESSVNLVLGTIGGKFKIGNDFLFTASVVFPLNSAGIKPGVTPVVGFERAF